MCGGGNAPPLPLPGSNFPREPWVEGGRVLTPRDDCPVLADLGSRGGGGGGSFRRGTSETSAAKSHGSAPPFLDTTLEPTQGQKSIPNRCYLREVALEWELTKETIYLPPDCLQGGPCLFRSTAARWNTAGSLTPCTLRHTSHTLHPTPHTPHPAPYTLHPTPYTLQLTPYTLHPAPYTIHPTPNDLHPTPLSPNLQP